MASNSGASRPSCGLTVLASARSIRAARSFKYASSSNTMRCPHPKRPNPWPLPLKGKGDRKRQESGHVVAHHPPRVFEVLAKVESDRTLEARMQFAVAAADVLLGAVVFPVGRRVQFLERLVVPVGDQIAG